MENDMLIGDICVDRHLVPAEIMVDEETVALGDHEGFQQNCANADRYRETRETRTSMVHYRPVSRLQDHFDISLKVAHRTSGPGPRHGINFFGVQRFKPALVQTPLDGIGLNE